MFDVWDTDTYFLCSEALFQKYFRTSIVDIFVRVRVKEYDINYSEANQPNSGQLAHSVAKIVNVFFSWPLWQLSS